MLKYMFYDKVAKFEVMDLMITLPQLPMLILHLELVILLPKRGFMLMILEDYRTEF